MLYMFGGRLVVVVGKSSVALNKFLPLIRISHRGLLSEAFPMFFFSAGSGKLVTHRGIVVRVRTVCTVSQPTWDGLCANRITITFVGPLSVILVDLFF